MNPPSNALPQRKTMQPSRLEIIGQAEHLRLALMIDERGTVEFGGSPSVVISIHVGRPVEHDCRRGGERFRGRAVHGDVEIIPPMVPGVWEVKSTDTALVARLGLELLHGVVEEYGGDPARFEVRNRFHHRDPRIERIGSALKEEMEQGYPCGRVYMDSLTTALAAAVVQNQRQVADLRSEPRSALSKHALGEVLAFIDDNLDRDLRLRDLAAVGGMGVSRFKQLFRQATGISAYQYLIRRRVDRAAMLLRTGKLPIGRVALETGFCHQSHLAMHMRRLLGVSPGKLKKG